jgi:menaquinone-9 beta-reductase
MTDTEIAIAGGGPAGSAAAIALAQAGHRVTLIERHTAPRESVCGEFLGPDAVALLTRLDLSPQSLGGVPITRLRLAHRRRRADLALPFTAWAVPRARLDPALRARAITAGAALLSATIQEAEPGHTAAPVALRLTAGMLRARHLVAATGKHRLRGVARPHGAATGIKLHLRLARPLEGTILIAGPGFYAGLQAGPDATANLCAAYRGRPPQDAATLIAQVSQAADLAADLLDGAVPLWPRPLAIAGVPYGWMHRGTGAPSRIGAPFRIGDAFAVVPSFCGDGMAMALAAGLALPDALTAGPDAFHGLLRRKLRPPMRWAALPAALLATAPGPMVAAAAAFPAAASVIAAGARVRT